MQFLKTASGFVFLNASIHLVFMISTALSVSWWPPRFPSFTRQMPFSSIFKRSVTNSTEDSDEEFYQSTPKLIVQAGYDVQTHHTATEDGFVLELHRILPKGGSPWKSAVLIMHGYSSTSINWILNSAKIALPFKLSDLGYDVWLGNFRGNKYSDQHLRFTKNDSQYWDFSFHEMGMYDIPAMTDYILRLRNTNKLYYVGHSMGTTALWVALSLRPEYNEKIKFVAALAPIAYFKHVAQVKLLAPILNDRIAYDVLGYRELVPAKILETVRSVGSSICKKPGVLSLICNNVESFVGTDRINSSWTHALLRNYPDRSSTRTLLHFFQIMKSDRFSQYDFGLYGNLRIYNQPVPPQYPLSQITAPVAIYYSPMDWLAPSEDVEILARQLPNLVIFHKIEADTFNHLDFLSAENADVIVYNQVISAVETFETSNAENE